MRSVTLLPGDGDLAAAARRVIDASGAKLQWDVVGDLEHATASLRRTRVGLAASFGGSASLQQALDLFLTIVPATPSGLESEAVFLIGRNPADREACARIAHGAFMYAAMHARPGILLVSGAVGTLMGEVVRDATRDYPQIPFDEKPAEELDPRESTLDLLVGADSALAGAAEEQVGGGMVPCTRMGEQTAVFEGKGPAAIMRAAALLLEHLNEAQACRRVQRAIEKVLAGGAGGAPAAPLADAILEALPR